MPMRPEIKEFVKHSAIELLVYAVLVVGYLFLVLHFLGGWIFHLFQQQRAVYAGVALVLILGQGILLELVTAALLRFIRAGGER